MLALSADFFSVQPANTTSKASNAIAHPAGLFVVGSILNMPFFNGHLHSGAESL